MSSNKALGLAACVVAFAWGETASAVEDLAALRVEGQRGQTAEQARRDRYECHNWAVEQTGETPVAAPPEGAGPSDEERARRAETADRALTGAAIGAGVGGIAAGRNPGEGALAGAAVGAAIGAITGKQRERRAAEKEEAPSDYLRALTACLEGRGYTVSMPSRDETTAQR